MANEEQLAMFHEGVEAWNAWRKKNRDVWIDLSYMWFNGGWESSMAINLAGAYLYEANFMRAAMPKADFRKADVRGANFHGAHLDGARFDGASASGARFSGAWLNGASFQRASLDDANFVWARLERADLREARLRHATFVGTDLTRANLAGCSIYGISVWRPKLDDVIQTNLVITPNDEPSVTVDNLEVAQFIYLLLHNEKIRDVIDTVGKKAVLILGRFTTARKQILDAIRNDLRARGYLPILFDFQKPKSKDLTETISILAHMARFVIADLTDAKSIPQELSAIVPHLPSVPVQPILLTSQQEYSMFEHWPRFPWVLDPFSYEDQTHLIEHLEEKVIAPPEKRIQGKMTESSELEQAKLRIKELEEQLAKV
jgi:uncharacterized protein YjbI with pentapeptide repeats